MNKIEFLRKNGYPLKIKGNDGYEAVLIDIQELLDGDFCGVYRYPGGRTCHFLSEINSLVKSGYFKIIIQ